MRVFGRLIALAVFCVGLALIGTTGFVYLYKPPDPAGLEADYIVVLSGPGGGNDPITGETRERTDRGLGLFLAGAAPQMVMTGGGTDRAGLWDAQRMAAYAGTAGAPETAILLEDASFSTLQNAWFTADLPGLTPDARILLVTHRYHLPRAWASFRWVGFRNVTLVAADAGPSGVTPGLLMEGLKWPFNVARAILASGALAAGVAEDEVLPWLR